MPLSTIFQLYHGGWNRSTLNTFFQWLIFLYWYLITNFALHSNGNSLKSYSQEEANHVAFAGNVTPPPSPPLRLCLFTRSKNQINVLHVQSGVLQILQNVSLIFPDLLLKPSPSHSYVYKLFHSHVDKIVYIKCLRFRTCLQINR